MGNVRQIFTERVEEIESYLQFLSFVQLEIQTGIPKIGDAEAKITVVQQRILYSTVYLQLYNLVEATITNCVKDLSSEIVREEKWKPLNLISSLKREWLRYKAQTHKDLSYDNRLNKAAEIMDHLVQDLPIKYLDIEKGGGGNWDDAEIYRFSQKIGHTLNISEASNKAIKQHIKDEKGALALIVSMRNDLAHGSISFSESGADIDVDYLQDLKLRTVSYLSEVIDSFEHFIKNELFIDPASRININTTGLTEIRELVSK